jgi:Flp pilus assembly protein TadG
MNMTLSPLHKAKGVVLVLVALALVVLMGMAALAIDLSHAEVNKTRLQNLADSLALSAAISLNKGDNPTAAEAYARTNTLNLFKNSGGNAETKAAIASTPSLDFEFTFAKITDLSTSTTGDWKLKSDSFWNTNNPNFVRVTSLTTPMNISTWFARVIGFNNMAVSASAVAGTAQESPCDLTPFAMCAGYEAGGGIDTDCTNSSHNALGLLPTGNPDCYGYELNALYCMKEQSASGDPEVCPSPPTADIGAGNFGFLDFSFLDLPKGFPTPVLEHCIAGNSDCRLGCQFKGTVPTKTGETFGQVESGFNTRFGLPGGSLNKAPYLTLYPSDKLTGEQDAARETTPLNTFPYNYRINPYLTNGEPYEIATGVPNPAFVSYVQIPFQEKELNNAHSSYISNPSGIEEQATGKDKRRILAIPFIDCSVPINGKKDVKIVGYGCFYMAREYANVSAEDPKGLVKPYYKFGDISANKRYLYGQFIDPASEPDACIGAGNIVSDVDTGFFKVILYKDPFGGHS